jgi:predicted O-methyltransferase YrrM
VIDIAAAAILAENLLVHDDHRPDALKKLRDAEHPAYLYYRFLHELVRAHGALDVIEIGTYVGTSAAHFAHGNAGRVLTIDINPDAKRQADALGYSNLEAITSDSAKAGGVLIGQNRQCDVLYIDGNHTFNQAWGEYLLYRPLVREGGFILFDDAGLPMDGDEMNVLWDLVPEPKHRLDFLHATGFGIVQKSRAVRVPIWKEAVRVAGPMIRARQKARS